MLTPDTNLDALARYIEVLAAASRETTTAGDRPRYRDHLAAAAEMFAAMHFEGPSSKLKQLTESETRSYGLGYLSEDCGDRANSAFVAFVDLLDLP